MANTEEITGVFVRETHRWDDVCIAEFRYSNGTGVPSLVPVKLQADLDELRPHSTYRLYGSWSEYQNKRLGATVKQFHAKTFIRSAPHGKEGVIRYLVEAPGIGPATAQKLWDAFQGDAVRILRETPDVAVAAVAAPYFTLEKAKDAAAYLETEKSLEGCSLDLVDLLGGRGFPKSTPKKCLKEWGNTAAARIRRSPYTLMQFKGCGFIRCDQLYLDLGHNPNALKRQALAAWYVLARDTEGHTWLSAEAVEEGMRKLVRFADPVPALKLAKRAGLISVRRDDAGSVWLAEGKKARQEATVAELAAAMASRPGQWPSVDELDVSDHQREQARRALLSQIAILCGSPGTGKTYTAARIIKVLCELWGSDAIGVCAPTGKAASRISEAMASYGLPLTARTIHSTLGVDKHNDEGEWGFTHGPGLPLQYRCLVIDEGSMIDTGLMAALMAACGPGTHVLIIGDTNQLPPVGHGAPLRDLIAAGVPCGELREIRRNSGTIVRACALIRDGEQFQSDAALDPENGANLKVIETSKPETTTARIIDTIRRIAAGGIGNPIWDCQVIVAVNKKSQLSRKEINKQLQGELNPDGYTTGGNPFRVGDKIVCLKNSFLKPMDEADPDNLNEETGEPLEIFVANGELLKVTEVAEKWTAAEITCGPWKDTAVRIPRGKADAEGDGDKGGGGGGSGGDDENEESSGTGCQFDLGYAISCHKCVSPDTLIETDHGLMPIRDVADTGVIAGPDGPTAHKNRVHYEDAECWRITTENGHTLTVSRDHRCEVWDGKSWTMVIADDVKEGQWVRQRLGVTIDTMRFQVLPELEPQTACDVPSLMSGELAEFFGLMVADGTIFRGGFRLAKSSQDVVGRFAALASHLFGIPKQAIEHKDGVDGGWYVAELHSTALAQWLREVGGMSPHSKHVPRCVLSADTDIHRAFLRGLFEDGSVHVRDGKLDHINWTTAYPKLMDAVRIMLLRLRIVCSVNGRRLDIYSHNAQRFQRLIGFITPEKNERAGLPIFGNGNAESQRFRVPVNTDAIREIRAEFVQAVGLSTYQNALHRKYVSRDVASKVSGIVSHIADFEGWHYSRIESKEAVLSPVMCVETDCGRFLQNGFPWGNSQGSEWPVVIVVLDDYAGARRVCGREWLYTAISRGKTACLLIGPRRVAESMVHRVALVRRKTFCRELILAGLRLEGAG